MQTNTTNYITTIKTDKFKTTVIKVAFKAKLSRETITKRNLLADVLRNSSRNFPSKKILSAHLEDLYGASLSVSAKKQGTVHAISFYIQVANEKFLKSAPPLFATSLKTLSEVIMNPKIENNAFDEDVVNLEKRLLKEDIESVFDDKTTYALKKMVEIMCKDENFGINGDGYIEDLPNITNKTLVETYESMLKDDELSIVVLGDVDHDEVVNMVNANFTVSKNTRHKHEAIDREDKFLGDVSVLKENQSINQAKLNIGYRTFTRVGDKDYFDILVFNGVFGAFAHSKLFVNVREKESLCYYCASQVDNFKGIMYVYSGLDLAQVEKAKTIIDKQLEDICLGNITDQELNLAKKSIVNAKRSALDSASGMLSDLEASLLLGITSEDFIKKIEDVTKEDVVAVAKKIKKDTIFTLEPMVSQTQAVVDGEVL